MISIKNVKIMSKAKIHHTDNINKKMFDILTAEKVNLYGFPNPAVREKYQIFNRDNLASNSNKYFIFFEKDGNLKYINFFSFKDFTAKEISEIVFIFKIRMSAGAFLLTEDDFEKLKKSFAFNLGNDDNDVIDKRSYSNKAMINKVIYSNNPLFLIENNYDNQIENKFKLVLKENDDILIHSSIMLTYLQLENSLNIKDSFYSKFNLTLKGPKNTIKNDFEKIYQNIILFIKEEGVDEYISYPLYLQESIEKFFCYHTVIKVLVNQMKAELEYAFSIKENMSENHIKEFDKIISKKMNFIFKILANNMLPYITIKNIAMFILNELFNSSKMLMNNNPMMLVCCNTFTKNIRIAMMNANHVEYYKLTNNHFESNVFENISFLKDIKEKYEW